MFFNFLQFLIPRSNTNFSLLIFLITFQFRFFFYLYLTTRFKFFLFYALTIKFKFKNFNMLHTRKKLKLKKRKSRAIKRFKNKAYFKKSIKLKLHKFLSFPTKFDNLQYKTRREFKTYKYFFKNFYSSKMQTFFLTHKKMSRYSLINIILKKNLVTKSPYVLPPLFSVTPLDVSLTLKKLSDRLKYKNKKESGGIFDFLENNRLFSNKTRVFFFFETSYIKSQPRKNKFPRKSIFFKIAKFFKKRRLQLHFLMTKKNVAISNNKFNSNITTFFQKKFNFFKPLKRRNKHSTRYANFYIKKHPNSFFSSRMRNKISLNSTPLKILYKTSLLASILFFSKWNASFLGPNFAFLFSTLKEFCSHNLEQNIINYKKELFSFNMKNEPEKKILKKRVFLNSINYFLNSETFNAPIANYFDFKLLPINNNKPNFLGTILTNKIWNNLEIKQKYINLLNETDPDLIIKRIRFKPGYSIIWREARAEVKKNLSISLRYQWRLTHYLSKFKKTIKNKLFFIKNFTILKLFVKTKFLPDADSSNFFIENGLVFLNANPCYNKNIQVFTGDCIQLIVTIKYYLFFKNLINAVLIKQKKINFLIKKKKFVPDNYEEKQKSKNFPKSIMSLNDVLTSIPRHLEVDFFSLSCVILFEPFLWNDLNYDGTLDVKWFVLNMYNWKYIN